MRSLATISLLLAASSMSSAAPSRARHATPPAPSAIDLLVSGGTVYTGDAQGGQIADVGIDGDRIVFVGNAATARVHARRTLSAKGFIVSPGFIDAHVHAEDDLSSPDRLVRTVSRQIMQGVTTSIIGVDGDGPPEVAASLGAYERSGIGQNVAAYVGFGTVRQRVLGDAARAPDASELASMRSLVAKGMCEGALGLSSGLFYAPQSFATTEEVISVAREAGLRGGLYDTHQRDEGDSTIGVGPSLKEAIRIGRESGAPLHVAHIKISGGSRGDGSAMAALVTMIEEARAAGQPVTADQYPWTAANTGLDAAVIPRWAQDGGRTAMLRHFDVPADADRIRRETRVTDALSERVLINKAPGQPDAVGKRLSELATMWKITPIDAAMRLLKTGDVTVAVFVMAEADIRKAMVQPWVMSSSDGRSGGHPRAYASFPKLWADYVITQKVLTPEQFVRRSTAFPADTLGLSDRGRIRVGGYADVVAFDPTRFLPKATFVKPKLLATGMMHVIVNGKIELADGRLTGLLGGRALLKKRPVEGCL